MVQGRSGEVIGRQKMKKTNKKILRSIIFQKLHFFLRKYPKKFFDLMEQVIREIEYAGFDIKKERK